jgi:hypothetical protein
MNGIMVTNHKQLTKSRFLGDRDTCLPPKADKYRIRSSIADGEAALPPSKRRQRALEAMSACAAEAAEGVEGQQTVKSIMPKDERIKNAAEVSPISKFSDLDTVVQLIPSGNEKVNASQLSDEIAKHGVNLSSDHQHTVSGSESKLNASAGVLDHKRDNILPLRSPKTSESGKSKPTKFLNQSKPSEGSRIDTEKLDMKPKLKSTKNIPGTEKVNEKDVEKYQDQQTRYGKQDHFTKHGKYLDITSKHSDSTSKTPDQHGKQAGMNNLKSSLPKAPLEVKLTVKQTVKNANAIVRGRHEILGAPKLQIESNSNKVREA